MKKYLSIILSVVFLCMSLSGCTLMDKILGDNEDVQLYKAIAASDELIVVFADGVYQVRVINGTGDDITTNDYVFSDNWTVKEDHGVASYQLSHDGDKYSLFIYMFNERVSGAKKVVQPLDGEEDTAEQASAVSSDDAQISDVDSLIDSDGAVSSDGATGEADASSTMKTKRIVSTGYSDEGGDGYEVFSNDGTYLVHDDNVFAMIMSAYDKGIKAFYADCLPPEDLYAGTITSVMFAHDEQDRINADLADYLSGDTTGKGIGENGEITDYLPAMPAKTEKSSLKIIEHLEDKIDDAPAYMLVDEKGSTYYILTDDMYNTAVSKLENSDTLSVEWGKDASGYNVITYIE